MRKKTGLYIETAFYTFLAVLIIIQHRGFLSYLAQWQVIKNLSLVNISSNLIVTPSILLLFAVAFYAYGKCIAAILIKKEALGDYAALVYASLGMGALNLFFYYAGAAGILYPWLVITVLAAGSMLAAYDLIRSDAEFRVSLPDGGLERAAMVVTIVAIGYNYFAAAAPPSSWDAVSYHLPIPRYYALAHGIVNLPYLIFKQTSIGGEMLNAAALLVSNDSLPQYFSVFTVILIVRFIYVFGKKHFSEKAARVACALFTVTPAVMSLGCFVTNDLSAALYAVLAVAGLVEYSSAEKNKSGGWLFISAAFCGLAAATKMNGAMTVVCVAGGALLLAASGKIKLSAKRAGLAAAIFLFFALPPFVQRYFWTENPFFPYLTGIFGSNVKDAQYVIGRWGAELAATVGMPATLFNFVLMPYHLIVNPGRFQNFPQYFALSASILLAVRLFSKRKISPVGLGLAAYILAYFIFWFFFGRVWRLMLLPLPFMLLFLCSWPFQENDKFARGAMLLVLCINLIPPVTWGVNNQLFGAFALPSLDEPGKPSRERYLEKALNSYATFAYANEHLDNNAFVLLFSEVRGYYLRKNYMWGDPLNQALIAYQNYASPEELLARLRELGVTHIIINYASYGVDELYYNERTMLLMSGVISRHAKRIYSENSVILYELEGVK